MLHHIDRLLAFWHLQAPSRDVPSQSCHSFRQLASCERRPRKYNFGSKSSIESSTQMTHEPNKLRFIYTICLPSFRSLLEAMNDSLMARMPAIGTFGGNHGRCPYLGGSALLPIPCASSSYTWSEQCTAAHTGGCSLAQEGFRPSKQLQRVTSIEPGHLPPSSTENHVRH